jgi:hypothetical protein
MRWSRSFPSHSARPVFASSTLLHEDLLVFALKDIQIWLAFLMMLAIGIAAPPQ